MMFVVVGRTAVDYCVLYVVCFWGVTGVRCALLVVCWLLSVAFLFVLVFLVSCSLFAVCRVTVGWWLGVVVLFGCRVMCGVCCLLVFDGRCLLLFGGRRLLVVVRLCACLLIAGR